jgi:hypothetical protein
MGLQHYTQDMSKIPLKYHKKVLFYTKFTHPIIICRGTDGRTDARTENIYSILRDKLLLRGEHVLSKLTSILMPLLHPPHTPLSQQFPLHKHPLWHLIPFFLHPQFLPHPFLHEHHLPFFTGLDDPISIS